MVSVTIVFTKWFYLVISVITGYYSSKYIPHTWIQKPPYKPQSIAGSKNGSDVISISHCGFDRLLAQSNEYALRLQRLTGLLRQSAPLRALPRTGHNHVLRELRQMDGRTLQAHQEHDAWQLRRKIPAA